MAGACSSCANWQMNATFEELGRVAILRFENAIPQTAERG